MYQEVAYADGTVDKRREGALPVATSVGAWIRVSSGGQDEANQVPELERYCGQRGYRINTRYEVHDKSAFHGEQEAELKKMLEDIRTGVIQRLVCWHSDRLERRGVEKTFELIRLVKEAGGTIESVKEPTFGLADVSAEAMTAITAVMSHAKSYHLAEQVGIAHDRIRENGGLLGRAPWGYRPTGVKYNKTIEPTDIGRKYIPQIFDRIIDGESLAHVCAWLDSERVPTATATGKPWDRKSLSQIMRNRAYMGYHTHGDGTVMLKCEAVIDAATFRRAGERLDSWPKRGPQNNANKALLTSALFCVTCKSPMYKVKTGAIEPYYRCSGKYAANGKSCFMSKMSLVDAMVDKGMSRLTEPIMKRVLIPGHNYEAELDDLKFQINSLDVDDPDYDNKHAALVAERNRIKGLDIVPDEWMPQPVKDSTGNVVTYASKWKASDPAGKRDMVKDMSIHVGKNDNGELWGYIEILDADGQVRSCVMGNLPGPTLLERAEAHGIVGESYADEYDET